jgi:DNA-binding winged helix-turn-helix (wHTH) protein
LGHNVLFLFNNYLLDSGRRELRAGDALVALEPQVFDILVYLIENRDRVISKDDLIASVWGGRIVSESTLTSRINAVRKAIGDTGKKQSCIRTFARKGFRFVAPVEVKETAGQVAGVEPGPAKTVHRSPAVQQFGRRPSR